jgi:AraC-like DNA-binding protein
MSGRLPSPVAALGWLHTSGDESRTQLALPTDLFMVTVRCGNGVQALRDAQPALDLTVTLLRTRPERFCSRVAGELAYALLTPAGLLALLRAPLRGAADLHIPLARFCSTAELRAFRDAMRDSEYANARTRLFGAWIEDRIKQRHRFGVQQQRVAEATAVIQGFRGSVDLASLRRELLVSQRQLERDFRYWLGVSPAFYARLVRFQFAAMSLAGGEALGGTAAQHGYADQSHLNRAFRELSLLTPREFAHVAAQPRRQAERRALAGRVVLVDAPGVPGAPA